MVDMLEMVHATEGTSPWKLLSERLGCLAAVMGVDTTGSSQTVLEAREPGRGGEGRV